MARYSGSSLVWAQTGGRIDLFWFGINFGTVPLDIAGSPGGRLALVGYYVRPDGQVQGWVTSFAP